MTTVCHRQKIFLKMEKALGAELKMGREKAYDTAYFSPLDPTELFADYIAIVRQLRSQCPWDREQTHESMTHLLIEEAHEVVQAIEEGDSDSLKAELGDLLLHVVFHAILASEDGGFVLSDVIEASMAKLIGRHPHVFGDIVSKSAEEVLQNWETIKRSEKPTSSILSGVPESMPPLLAAFRIQEKVGSVGFDFLSAADSADKVDEEIGEFREAGSEEEFGDLLFALVNYARHMGIMPDRALRRANKRFRTRFQFVESKIDVLQKPPVDEMESYWKEAKQREGGKCRADG